MRSGELKEEIDTFFLKRQLLPIDMENPELRKLADRLKGDTEKETLTNILEWQDRNIKFWWERWPFDLSLTILIPFSTLLVLLIFLPFLSLLYDSKFLDAFGMLVIVLVIFFVMMVFSNTVGKLFYLFLVLPLVYLFTILAFRNWVLAQIIFPYTLIYVGCLGAIALIMVYLFIRYNTFLGKKPIIEKISKFTEMVNDTFLLSLPIGKILMYKSAICKDYAKLTASLLFITYPDSELRFITKPSHVAAGIVIKNKIYALDQHLPIESLDNWQISRNTEADIYKLKIDKKSKKESVDVVFIRHVPIPKKSNELPPKVDTEKLTEEIAQKLEIKQIQHIEEPYFEKPLPNYAIYYDNDEIIKCSLIRYIQNMLQRELCGKVDKISYVNISQKEKDLMVSVWL